MIFGKLFSDRWTQDDRYTAVSRKVVLQKWESEHDNVEIIMGTDGFALDWDPRYFGAREGSGTNTSIHALSFPLAKHREPQSISTKLLLNNYPAKSRGILSDT